MDSTASTMSEGASERAEQGPKLDLYFPVLGREIPLDHGYLLFSAVSRLLETSDDQWLHASDAIGLHPIRGHPAGRGRLALLPTSRLGLRLPAVMLPRFLPLAGKQLQLGTDKIRLGVPQPHALVAAPTLHARLVTTRNGQDEGRFDEEIARQLAALDVTARVERGQRRIFRIQDKKVVGYALTLSGVSADHSIRVQGSGLGGRRKMGCGLFLPCGDRAGEQK